MPNVESESLAALRQVIRSMEQGCSGDAGKPAISLGEAVIDAALPWGGLARAGLHEIGGDGTAGAGFNVGVLRRSTEEAGRILWCRHTVMEREVGLPYGPGLSRFGLAPEQLLFVRARKPADVLWAMEEGLRSGCLSAVVGDGIQPDFTATRRLQLAAEASGMPAFLLPPFSSTSKAVPLSAALTRWRVHALPSTDDGAAMCWQIKLVRCRGGAPKDWIVEWDEQTLCFRLAEALADRQTAAG